MGKISHRRISTNNIELHIAEIGQGPLILFIHGFPESWYSWRHQLPAIAKEGYHCVAPDMRGYGQSDKPKEIEAYNQVEVTKDIIGLISKLGYETAIVVGHDWGAPTAWSCALNYPQQVSAVVALSVPFVPRPDASPLTTMKQFFKEIFFYQLYFQKPGIAESELERNIEVSLRKFYYLASGDNAASDYVSRSKDSDLLSHIEDPKKLGAWCDETDLQYYIEQFTESGFRGPLNYYRNHDLSWSLTENAPVKIEQPAMFLAGEKDGVIIMAAEAIKKMPNYLSDLRVNELIPEAGHWTQQEAPELVNKKLIGFLRSLESK
ncbi:MAG: pimeloyl-ACP methyl ester carboxylesterase [Candidatus Azotimanducaceae bacterium]|jgi:pimeloyl-ACP methyl ester carboxylesterase